MGSGPAAITTACRHGVDFALSARRSSGFLPLLRSSPRPTSRICGSLVGSGELAVWPHRLTLCCQLAMAATMAHMLAVDGLTMSDLSDALRSPLTRPTARTDADLTTRA